MVGLASALAVYTLVGFLLVPRLVRYVAIEYVREAYGRTLSVGELRFHPYKLQLEIRDLSFPDRDRTQLFSFGRVLVNFDAPTSIWKRAFAFHEVSVVQPALRAIIRPNGELNLADLQGKAEPQEKEDDDLPRVWIAYLTVAHGTLDFADRARREPFQTRLSPLDFTLKDFRTMKGGAHFQLVAGAAQGAQIAWEGDLVLSPSTGSHGELTIGDFPASALAEYLGEAVPFHVPRGKLDLRASYRVSAGRAPSVEIRVSELAAHDIDLRAHGERASWVRLPKVVVNDAVAKLDKRAVTVAEVTLHSPFVEARLEQGNELNLTKLFAAEKRAAVAEPLAKSEKTKPPDGTPSTWDVQLASVSVVHGKVELEDASLAPGTRFTLSPLNAHAEDVSLDLARAIPVQMDLAIDDDADVHVRGTLTPQPFHAELDVELDDAALKLGQPYVSQQAALTIRRGSVSAKGRLELSQEDLEGPELHFRGDVVFKDFASIDDLLQQAFVNFEALELKGVDFTRGPDVLTIAQITVQKPYARVVLSEKRVLNVSEILVPERKREPASAPRRSEALPQRAPMVVRVGDVRFRNMRLNFSDYFVKPNFSADMQGLNGSLKGLSSEPKARAQLRLEGSLVDNAPVVISGKAQPFDYGKFTEVTIECSNIALPVFNPYSGRFAGYNIARGELSTDLHYLVVKRRLTAQHHIRIDQLTWGERTETKEKAPFPVKLATALLRDREGVITLDIPVDGTLDDPEFELWPVVWKTVKNVLAKAVSAPFDLLGSLFEGAEKARFVDFAPGSAELDQNAKAALAALSKALEARPKLRLDVPLGTASELDRRALADQKFAEGLARSAAATLSRREKRDGVPPFEELAADQQIDALEKLYEDLTGTEPKVKEVARAKDQSRKAAKESKQRAKLEQLTAMTRQKVTVEQAELEALGRRRGQAIEAELIRGGEVDPTRVLLSKEGEVSVEQRKIRYELQLQ